MIGALLGGIDLTRWAVYGALATAASAVLMGIGYHLGVRQLWEYQAQQARAAIPVIVRQGQTTEKVVTKYRDRIVKVHGETVTIEKEIVRYVPPATDCVLPRGWLLLHDAAATRALPTAAPGADVTAPGIAASEALKGVLGNYSACHKTSEQLVGLQEWVRGQYEAMNQQPQGY